MGQSTLLAIVNECIVNIQFAKVHDEHIFTARAVRYNDHWCSCINVETDPSIVKDTIGELHNNKWG